MAGHNRLLAERALDPEADRGQPRSTTRRPVRSVTVNIAESPLGWLFARGHLSQRQFDAGERLRFDYERGQLSQRVTMAWDAAPVARGRGGSSLAPDLSGAQIDAKARFQSALRHTGPGLAETALGWPARAGKLVLTLALDRVADHYRIR